MSRVRYDIFPHDTLTNRLRFNTHSKARVVGPADKLIIKLLKLCKNSEYFTFTPNRGVVTYKDAV